jgi:DNA modification methylase
VSGNSLYFGENLEILRNEIRDESVDLIYLDPPFNSKAAYNRLFRTPKGHEPHAQATAFEDTWHWGEQAEQEFAELIQQPNIDVSEMMQALRRFLGENDVMAYLTMMANRLLELHRVLKPTGSIYLHCDPTASHYLKIVLDGVFGKENYVNEIIWRRYGSHNDVGQGSQHFGRVHDTIFFYSKTTTPKWNQVFTALNPEYVKTSYRYVEEKTGRRFRVSPMTGPGGAAKGNPVFEWKGHTRAWRYSKATMEQLDREGRIYYSKTGYAGKKLYLDESRGTPVQDVWDDISSLSGAHGERLGYQTQKPLQLLERLITASSNEGDIILDPFCGCGTAIHAAEKLKRRWIGIDITHLAISLVEERLRKAFLGIEFEVHGTPKDLDSARDLARRNKYEFQWWACSLVNAEPYQGKKKGADSGIDGVIYFQDDQTYKKIIVSVKGGENISVPMIRDLGHVVNREKASRGYFVTLTKPTGPMRQEAVKAGFYVNPMGKSRPKIQIFTVEGLLDGTERPDTFDLTQGDLMKRKPKREIDAIQLSFPSAASLSAVPATEETPRKPARVARAAKPRKARRKTA